MKTVRWAMIGCGDVTEKKSGPGLYKAESSSLAGVYNRTFSKAEDYAKRHKIPKVYISVQDLLDDDAIDAVYIATPPVSHFDYAVKTLEAGKIPYIEKPLVMNHQEALALKALSEQKGIPVYVAFYRRGLEKFLKIKEILESGTLGKILFVHVMQLNEVSEAEKDKDNLPWRVIPSISGGGKFLDVGVHVLDCLIWYFGEMESLYGQVQNLGGYYEAEDTLNASFRFKSGICGTGTWCFVADKDETTVTIAGEKGRLVYDGMSPEHFILQLGDKETPYSYNIPEHVAMPLEQAIVNEILGKEKSHADFNQAVNLMKMTDQLLAEYYTNKTSMPKL